MEAQSHCSKHLIHFVFHFTVAKHSQLDTKFSRTDDVGSHIQRYILFHLILNHFSHISALYEQVAELHSTCSKIPRDVSWRYLTRRMQRKASYCLTLNSASLNFKELSCVYLCCSSRTDSSRAVYWWARTWHLLSSSSTAHVADGMASFRMAGTICIEYAWDTQENSYLHL